MPACSKALKKAKDKKEAPEYEMPKSKAISEHKRLLKIMKPIKKEYKEQKSELKEIKKSKD